MTSTPGRLLVVSPNWLGDAVMALPTLGDLRRQFPTSRMIVAARGAVADLFAMSPSVDEVLVMEWSGRLWDHVRRRRDLSALRAVGADAAVLLPNSFASAWLVGRAGIAERWGYAADLRSPLLSRAIPRPAIRVHQAEYYRRLVRELGVANGPLEPELVVPPDAIDRARDLLGAQGWKETRPLVVVAPGAAYGGAKRWPSESFAAVVTRLVRDQGASCALVGSRADRETTSRVWSLVPDRERVCVFDLAGSTTLETLAGVMQLASACLSNDSGAMHLAGAVGVPLVALFGPTRERETSPLSRSGRPVRVLVNHVWCRPCMLRECPLDHRCMTGLLPAKVFTSVADLMTSSESPMANPESRVPDPEP